MSDDDTKDWAPHVNPGERAPIPASREVVPPATDWDELLSQTEKLFDRSRRPRGDILWRTCYRSRWEAWKRLMEHYIWFHVAMDGEDADVIAEARERLRIANAYLGRRIP